MKITKYITIACIVTSLSGCDYLDFDESIGKTQDEMYTYFENISSLATYIYSQLPQDYGAIGGAVPGCGNRQCRIYLEQQQCVRHL